MTDVATGYDSRSADEGSTNVGNNSSIQVGHDHYVELSGARNELHGTGEA